MTLIHKLGLLGLIGIVVLIVIYLIKPNYQQKTVSSTYVWKLSLKYRKKRLPTSKIRNVLLFLCQALTLACLAAVLVKPALVLKRVSDEEEIVVIIDASASMRAKSEETDTFRFERAVTSAKKQVQGVLDKGGTVTIMLAKTTPEYLYKRASASVAQAVTDALDALTVDECGYSGADLDAALAQSEEILAQNPDAAVYVYTDAKYDYIPEEVNVCNVAEEGEWNAAILSAEAAWDEGYYSFTVKVACYGKTDRLTVLMDVYGVNGFGSSAGSTLRFSAEAECDDGETKTLIFKYRKDGEADAPSDNQQIEDLGNGGGEKIASYSSVHISLEVKDCYEADDNFDIYGGQKQVLKVQYASSEPNPFVSAALDNLKADYADRWDIRVTEVKKGEAGKTEGFDLYIFEHVMPAAMPVDGVVYLFDPDSAPQGCGFRADGTVSV
ncbi:MAG: VWA domain-containing protein, partial [Candidatus Scatosoma sp.]